MTPRNSSCINDVDDLIAQTSIEQVLTPYGKPLPSTSGGEHRMQCVFNDDCSDSQYGNLTVRLDEAVNRIFCHSCGVRGNLRTLLHGLETHQPPARGRLRGDEFKSAVARLPEISGHTVDNTSIPHPAVSRSVSRPRFETYEHTISAARKGSGSGTRRSLQRVAVSDAEK